MSHITWKARRTFKTDLSTHNAWLKDNKERMEFLDLKIKKIHKKIKKANGLIMKVLDDVNTQTKGTLSIIEDYDAFYKIIDNAKDEAWAEKYKPTLLWVLEHIKSNQNLAVKIEHTKTTKDSLLQGRLNKEADFLKQYPLTFQQKVHDQNLDE